MLAIHIFFILLFSNLNFSESKSLTLSNPSLYNKYVIHFETNLPTNKEVAEKLQNFNFNKAKLLKTLDEIDKKCMEAEPVTEVTTNDKKEENLPELNAYVSRIGVLEQKIQSFINGSDDFDYVVRAAIFEFKEGITERRRRLEVLLAAKLGAHIRLDEIYFARKFNKNDIGDFLLNSGIPIIGTKFYSHAQLNQISRELETIITCSEQAYHICTATKFRYASDDCFNFIRDRVSLKHFYDVTVDAPRLDTQLNSDTNMTFNFASIKGERGSDGTDGQKGEPGKAGDDINKRGQKGKQGQKGDHGETGETGYAGEVGEYESKNGTLIIIKELNQIGGNHDIFTCPAQETYAGPKGNVGEDGIYGRIGVKGENGARGIKGEPGDDIEVYTEYEDGVDGEKGDEGECEDEYFDYHDLKEEPDNPVDAKWVRAQTQALIKDRVNTDKQIVILKDILAQSIFE